MMDEWTMQGILGRGLFYISVFFTSSRISALGLTPSTANRLFCDWRQIATALNCSQDPR